METHPLTIPDKHPNQVGFIPYIYLPKNSIGKAHEQSIYSKVPLHTLQGKSKSNSSDYMCRVHPKGTALDRIKLRHILIRNRQFANRSIND